MIVVTVTEWRLRFTMAKERDILKAMSMKLQHGSIDYAQIITNGTQNIVALPTKVHINLILQLQPALKSCYQHS